MSSLTPEALAALVERHTPPPVPPCPVCGGTERAPTGGPETLTACAAATREIRRYRHCSLQTAEVNAAWDHYNKSYWDNYREAEICPDVLTVAAALRETWRRIEALEAENARLRKAAEPLAAYLRAVVGMRELEADGPFPDRATLFKAQGVAVTVGDARRFAAALGLTDAEMLAAKGER